MRLSESHAIFLKFESKSGYSYTLDTDQFICVAYKGSYTFRQLNYIRTGVYWILTICDSHS